MKTKTFKLLLLALIAAMLPQMASAYDFEVDGLCYSFNSDGVSVTITSGDNYSSDIGDINIPSTVTYNGSTYSVTSIGEGAFSGCRGLTSVTIPNSVTSIGGWAFYGCSGLTSVSIGNSVTMIDCGAFSGCIGLTSVTIPNSVILIGDYAFSDCYELSSVTIPNSVTSIGDHAFYDCNLSSIYTKIKNPGNVSYGNEWSEIFHTNLVGCALLCKIYVPAGKHDSYSNTWPWNNLPYFYDEFYDGYSGYLIIEMDPTGDVNDDGTINVGDYVAVASYILEMDPQPFYLEEGDLDENLEINVGDLVGVAYLALNYEGKAQGAMHNAQSIIQNDEWSMGAVVQGNEVIINLSNNVDITAMQMDLTLPQGMTLVDASLTDRATASHQIEFSGLGNGDYRLLAASSALKSFKENNGAVLTLTLAGTPSGSGSLSNILLASPKAETFMVDDIALNFDPTGVFDVYTDARIYREGGNIVILSPADGVAQIVMPNGMNKNVKVIAGRNVYPAPATGLIIVKMGNEVKKMRF